MTPPRWFRRACARAAVAGVLCLGCWPAAAEPPVAPSPEPLSGEHGGVPATLVEPAGIDATGGSRRLQPVPLDRGVATAPKPAGSARDFGNWQMLAALVAAFAAAALVRLQLRRRPAPLPAEVFELLGEASLGGQQTARVVRFGPRTLLVGVSAAGCQTLATIDDPQATESIVAACRGVSGRPASSGLSGGTVRSRRVAGVPA